MQSIRGILEAGQIEASAPCRIDMGGTLDISSFYYPLRHLSPCTFNIAVNLRTRVCLFPYKKGIVKISSMGFKSAKYPLDKAPFNHPLGLMFAIAAYFGAEGVHIDVDSSSPPRSALGGSSAAAVALIAAFSRLGQMQTLNPMPRRKIALLAHALEESVAGVPCGLQDQLAAVYGGVNAWYWPAIINGPSFRKKTIVKKAFHKNLNKHLLLAYCGIPHESKNINKRWVEQFISGKYRKLWAEIILCTQRFNDALFEKNFKKACASMNIETAIRRKMTPDVLDKMGAKLVDLAVKNRCGARFTGAGGGGCIWAIGEIDDIDRLKDIWGKALLSRKEACLLDVDIDSKGLVVN
ncbi:MAG: galactokinase [Desulfobacterales bacterium]|uniref:Galactokinase n=1 Tax=Candidatus Desulfaltia bathyphila TaxID=2841697 RepID=A0A8J6N829_9BACT|nr:galactokinase [Candidatus Desulfaltia bathyphila]MBL7195589.1 galactokinase [Desulfobacterales bacterium]MBL7208019.1 galactokinase [Desulfobacterales bacterium]